MSDIVWMKRKTERLNGFINDEYKVFNIRNIKDNQQSDVGFCLFSTGLRNLKYCRGTA